MGAIFVYAKQGINSSIVFAQNQENPVVQGTISNKNLKNASNARLAASSV